MERVQIEKIKTGIIIVLGIIIVVGLIYIISDKTGNNVYNYNYNGNSDSNGNNQNQGENTTNPLLEDGEEIADDEQGELTSINYKELKSALNKGEKKFVFLGSEYCGWCLYQKPILKYIVYKYDVQINYLNVAEMTQDEADDMATLHDSLASFGTPTFIVIENKKVTVVDSGARGTKQMIQLLDENGFISD